MTDYPHRDDIPLPAAPTREEWEPFLRSERPSDNRPVIFTERQVARMHYIVSAALDRDSPAHAQALAQLAALEGFLGAVIIESVDGPAGAAPSSAERWARIDAMPHYLQPGSHARRIEDLRRRGLDPYGKPIDDD